MGCRYGAVVLRKEMLLVAGVVLVVACGSNAISSTTAVVGEDSTVPTSSTDQTNSEETTTVLSSSTTLVVDGIEVADEVIDFLVALDELMVDTTYEDAVTEDPEVFVATGRLFCEQLDQGVAPAEILTTYVETLTSSDIEAGEDDTLALAGSLLGTAVGFLCPEHTELIEENL